MLITSRGTGRWVIPKGNPIRGLPAHLAAAHEAFEEAGIAGVAAPVAIGSYGYDKVRANGSTRAARVEVFPLDVHSRYDDWPEQHQRETRWFDLADAAAAVEEPELKAIIAGFTVPGARLPGWWAQLRRWLAPPRARSAGTSPASPPATAGSN
jgi:8-oxo-dGTP pyrophosphatase MutT (NUDIX family)